MISDEKLKEIMGGIENRIRHAYNCGWNDGFGAMKEKVAKDIQERIEESVSHLFEQATNEFDGCAGCMYIAREKHETPCCECSEAYDRKWAQEV